MGHRARGGAQELQHSTWPALDVASGDGDDGRARSRHTDKELCCSLLRMSLPTGEQPDCDVCKGKGVLLAVSSIAMSCIAMSCIAVLRTAYVLPFCPGHWYVLASNACICWNWVTVDTGSSMGAHTALQLGWVCWSTPEPSGLVLV